MKGTQQTALNSSEIIERDGDIPTLVELIPAGVVSGRDGRSWQNDNPQGIIADFTARGMDLPIDLEHATELKAPKGEPAPAAGWVTALESRNGAIWGQVAWNQVGRDLVGGKQYRYLSPVILYHGGSGTIAGLTSVALTNRPNLNLQALNSQHGGSDSQKEDSMELKALLAALKLPENASFETAVAKIGSLQTDLETAINHSQSPSLEKFVPRADYDTALQRATNSEQQLVSIKTKQLEKDVDTAIEAALQAGKITPATVDYHKAQCRQEGGLELFAAFCQAAPVLGGASGLDGKTPDDPIRAMNSEEQKVALMFGNTAEDLAKYGK